MIDELQDAETWWRAKGYPGPFDDGVGGENRVRLHAVMVDMMHQGWLPERWSGNIIHAILRSTWLQKFAGRIYAQGFARGVNAALDTPWGEKPEGFTDPYDGKRLL